MKAEEKERDSLLSQVTESEIVASVQQVLKRARRWYSLHDRPIVSTDVGLYLKAFEAILVLDALPDIDTSKTVN
jgi:hypothetical protein